MDISITNSNDTIKLKYDLFGNVFLISDSDNDIYYLTIDSSNKPELMKVSNDKLEDLSKYNINFTIGKLYSGVPSLKGAVEDDISEKQQNNELDDEVELNDEYFPEHKYFYCTGGDIENEFINDSDIDPQFRFFNHKQEYVTELGYPTNALYSILIVDGTTKSKNIIFYSEEYNNTCSYRITFYTNGYIKCNIVGSYEKMYILQKHNDKLNIRDV
jgi:hypothetical protein